MRYTDLLLLSTAQFAWTKALPEHPAITPAPVLDAVGLNERQDKMDLASLAQVLVTAVPASILGLALTNVPAVSRLLWSEFLDDNTPDWFTALPTDIQEYLSGEFGPTTAASNSAMVTSQSTDVHTTMTGLSASQTAVSEDAVTEENEDGGGGGLPLWAKITIGILIPLFVIGLAALILFFCLRRRRARQRSALGHARSRTPTPAFISSSHKAAYAQPPGDQHLPLRGGHGSSTSQDLSQQTTRSTIGGPSYEDIGPAQPMPQSRRESRHSFSSLHSVPEVPEPAQDRYHSTGGVIPMPPPPRLPRRSQDLGSNGVSATGNKRHSPLNPMYNGSSDSAYSDPYRIGQGIYAGGLNPYPTSSYQPYHPETYNNNLFSGLKQDNDSNWPLQVVQDGGYRAPADERLRRHESKDIVYET